MSRRKRAPALIRLQETAIIAGWVATTFVATSLISFQLDQIWATVLVKAPTWFIWTVVAAAFVALCWVTWRGTDRLIRQIRARADVLSEAQVREDTGRRFIITGISKATEEVKDKETGQMVPTPFASIDGMRALLDSFRAKLATDGKPAENNGLDVACAKSGDQSFGPFGNWQQALRLIRALPHLEEMFVIENSAGQFDRFKMLINHFRPNLKVWRIEDAGWNPSDKPFTLTVQGKKVAPDYEDFDFCIAAINRAIKMIAQRGVSAEAVEDAVLIDVTPGLKTLSIVAAIASLNRSMVFVYVNNDGVLKGYDADLQLSGGA